MRITETTSLPASAIKPDIAALIINGKSGKKRMVPFPMRAVEAVGLWRRPVDEYGCASEKWLI